MSTGRMPCAFSSRTRDASIEGGRLVDADSLCLGKAFQSPLAKAEVGSRNTERITIGARCRHGRRASFQGTSPGAGSGRTRPGGRSPPVVVTAPEI
jgi:hypothetical protein